MEITPEKVIARSGNPYNSTLGAQRYSVSREGILRQRTNKLVPSYFFKLDNVLFSHFSQFSQSSQINVIEEDFCKDDDKGEIFSTGLSLF